MHSEENKLNVQYLQINSIETSNKSKYLKGRERESKKKHVYFVVFGRPTFQKVYCLNDDDHDDNGYKLKTPEHSHKIYKFTHKSKSNINTIIRVYYATICIV